MKIIIELLNDLIATNRGIIHVYQAAVEYLIDEMNDELLRMFVQQHQAFVAELGNLVLRYNGQPVTSANNDSLETTETWVALKATVTEGDGPILATVAHDAKNILGHMREQWPQICLMMCAT